MNPLKIQANINTPLQMYYDNEWMLISDYSEPEEYSQLDELFRYLTGDIPKSDLPDEFRDKSHGELKAIYEKRFTLLYGKVLQEVGKNMEQGSIIMDIELKKNVKPHYKEYIYVFRANLFDRDEAHKWVHQPHYAAKLKELIDDGRILVHDIRSFTKACNNREISNMFDYWLVRKIIKCQ